MEIRTKLEIGSFIVMAMLISGAYFIAQGDTAYYCESKDQVRICDKLSSGIGTRCYFNETYSICIEGWKLIEDEVEADFPEQIGLFANGENYVCEVINGKVNSYSLCFSDSNKSGYLGELV